MRFVLPQHSFPTLTISGRSENRFLPNPSKLDLASLPTIREIGGALQISLTQSFFSIYKLYYFLFTTLNFYLPKQPAASVKRHEI